MIGDNSLDNQAVKMRIPVLAFAFCMLMAPCASNAATLEDYDNLKLDKETKEILDSYLLGLFRGLDLANLISNNKIYCPPKNLKIVESLITHSIALGRSNEKLMSAMLRSKSTDLELVALAGLKSLFPCPK
jgi:hypothetical protein